jgi:transcription initiation factor IIF auxiliary subunit
MRMSRLEMQMVAMRMALVELTSLTIHLETENLTTSGSLLDNTNSQDTMKLKKKKELILFMLHQMETDKLSA